MEFCRSLLSSDEQVRAGRFYFERDRSRFVITRGSLRSILARYVNVPARELVFSYSDHGKPSLAFPESSDVTFNVSHSGDLSLVVVSRRRLVGVDVERIRPETATEDIAGRFFSTEEVRELMRLPEDLRSAGFFNCWTRKEAYIKALGEGLSHPLDSFAISLSPEVPVVLLWSGDDPEEKNRWRLEALHPGAGYIAALAVEGHDWVLSTWQWLPS